MLNKITHLLILMVLFIGCKVSDSAIVGKYIDYEKKDTLTLGKDKSYEFEEKLNSGENGWNTGNWLLNHRKITFSNTRPLAVVGCKVKLIKTGIGRDALQMTIEINGYPDKFKPFQSRVIRKNSAFDTGFITHKSNTFFLKSFAFDNLEIRLPYFPVLKFKNNEFEERGIYKLMIYPAERLYELDKLSYRYSKNKLINRKENIRYYKIETK